MSIVTWLTEPYFQFLPGNFARVLSAMVWGRKEFLSATEYLWFKDTGLLHILVLSGQNIVLVSNCLNNFCFGFSRRIRLSLSMFVAIFYLVSFVDEPSIVRASILSILVNLGMYWQINTSSVYLLTITGFGLLIIRPEWCTSLSFWLSISATFGLLVVSPYLKTKCPFTKKLDFASALSTQLLTFPLVFWAFRQYPLLSLPMNILTSLLIEPIMLLGLALSIFGHTIFLAGMIFSLPLSGLLALLLKLVQFGYDLSGKFLLRI